MLLHPSVVDFAGILRRCKQEKNRLNLLQFYGHIVRTGFESDTVLANCIVQTLIGIGHVSDAQHLFDRLAYRDEHSWNSLIAGHVKDGNPGKAFTLYSEIRKDEFVCTSGHAYAALLKACGKSKDLKRGLAMHDAVAKSGLLETDVFIRNSLIDMYVKCGSLEKAQQVFDMLLSRDVVAWTALLTGYSEHGREMEALVCFKRMLIEGVSPNCITIRCSLKACASMGAMNKGEEIHAQVDGNFLYASDVAVWNTLLDTYIKCGELFKARILFDKLEIRNVVSWTVLISGYFDVGLGEEAFKCCEQMKQEGVLPDAFTYACSLKICGGARAIRRGKQIHSLIRYMGLERDPFLWNSLIDMYAKNELFGEAHEIFYNIQVPDVVSWTVLISSYVESGIGDRAFQCFESMQLQGVIPNSTTFYCSISACGQMRDIDTIQRMHSKVEWMGILDRDIVVTNILVETYVKCGALVFAQKVFDRTQIRDVVLWTTLIAGYIEYGHGKQALKCLEQMKIEGLCPDTVMFIFSLKACACLGDLNRIKELHIEMVKMGLGQEDTGVSTLVDSYADCGSLAEAQGILKMFSFLGVSPWNALIGGYVERGDGEKALEYYEQMTLFGVACDSYTLIYGLKACSEVGNIDKGREIHAEIEKKGLVENNATGNALIHFYGQCGLIQIAQKIFDELPFRDVVSWNTLITAYAEYGYAEEAYACVSKMQTRCITPNPITFISILRACGNRRLIETVKEIHSEIERNGFLEGDFLLGNILVDAYAKCGLLAKAKQLFDQILELNVVSWTALITGYVEHKHAEEALKCFHQMQIKSVSPNSVTYASLLRSCGSLGAVREGQEMHADIVRKGLSDRDIVIANALVNMYGKFCCLAEAHAVFEMLPAPNIVSWTTLISVYVECGHNARALKCFERMQQDGVAPDASTFTYGLRACGTIGASVKGQEMHADLEKMGLQDRVSVCVVDMYAKCGLIANAEHLFCDLPVKDVAAWNALIAGYAQHGHADKTLRCLGLMQLEGISPNTVTFVCGLKACWSMQDIRGGQILHAQIEGEGLMEGDLVGNSLIEMYASCGAFADAWEIFNKLPQDVVTWTTLISTYTDHGFAKEALKCFAKMQIKGASPDLVTFICALKACGEIGAKDKALEMHSEIEKKGVLQHELTICNTLVNVYAKCGLNADTQKVFDSLVAHDIVSWNALMAGYVKLGDSAHVFQCFDRLLEQHLKPDLVTFLIILTACSHFSLFNESQRYLEFMSKKCGIAPTVDHITGVIHLLCRSGQIDIAVEMIRRMPLQNNLVMLRSVLNMCRWWGNANIGNQVFQKSICTNLSA